MKITIYDYTDTPKIVTIKGKICFATINIRSGDEILSVYKANGEYLIFDSSDTRIESYDDGSYVVYNPKTDTNYMTDKKWKSLTNSYSRYDYVLDKMVELSKDKESNKSNKPHKTR